MKYLLQDGKKKSKGLLTKHGIDDTLLATAREIAMGQNCHLYEIQTP